MEKTIEYRFKIIKGNQLFFCQLNAKAKELQEKIKKEKTDIDPEKVVYVKTDGTIFNFNKFNNSLDLDSNL